MWIKVYSEVQPPALHFYIKIPIQGIFITSIGIFYSFPQYFLVLKNDEDWAGEKKNSSEKYLDLSNL